MLRFLVCDVPRMSAVASVHAAVPLVCDVPRMSAVDGVPSVANTLAMASVHATIPCM